MRKMMETTMDQKMMDKEVKKVLADEAMSKSGKMKALFNLGLEVKDIAGLMNVRYNFVYNVVSNMIIVEGVAVESSKKDSKKDLAFSLFDQGKSTKEVAIEMKTSYNYIHKLKKEWEAEAVAEVAATEASTEAVAQ